MANILIIEDEKSINNLIQKNLHLVGHQCYSMFDGIDADKIVREKNIDLVILDIMLPKIDGYHVYENINFIPVIFLTAKDSLQDKVKGLTLGADDYIVKPFEMVELIARVEAVLRRVKKDDNFFEFKNIKIDFSKHLIYKNGNIIECTPKEFELFEVLVKNRNWDTDKKYKIERFRIIYEAKNLFSNTFNLFNIFIWRNIIYINFQFKR